MKRLFVNVKWQTINRAYQFRYPIFYFIAINLLLTILPVSVCQYLDRNFMILVNIVNILYVFSILFLFFSGISYVDEAGNEKHWEFIRLAEPNPWLRLLARLLTNAIFFLLCFANAYIGSSLMGKFADETHSYFELTMNGNPLRGFFLFSVIFPLLYHLINLLAHRGKMRSISIPALILLFFLTGIYQNISSRFPGWLVNLALAAVMAAVFWRAGELEKSSQSWTE